MVWAEQWDHIVSGTNLNDPAGPLGSFCEVPEINNGFPGEIVLVPAAGDVPWFHRVQPEAGLFTFNIQLKPCTWAEWETRQAAIHALFTAGVHPYIAQVRGMSGQKTYSIICDGGSMCYAKLRRLTFVATVLQQV